jgi:hypothetical protein
MFPSLRRIESLLPVQLRERIAVVAIAVGVVFASLGLGEAVYRFLFFEFEGATDRLPIEMMFGLAFAWIATKIVSRVLRYRSEAAARIDIIRARNRKIREAIAAIPPAPYVGNQQVVRVIREQLDHVDWTLGELASR